MEEKARPTPALAARLLGHFEYVLRGGYVGNHVQSSHLAPLGDEKQRVGVGCSVLRPVDRVGALLDPPAFQTPKTNDRLRRSSTGGVRSPEPTYSVHDKRSFFPSSQESKARV